MPNFPMLVRGWFELTCLVQIELITITNLLFCFAASIGPVQNFPFKPIIKGE